MKIAVLIILWLSPVLAVAEPSHYEMSIDIEVRDARAFLSLLNKELGLRLEDKVLADYAASIAVGNEYSDNVDLHHGGGVFTATYIFAKPKVGRVNLTFRMWQKGAARAICQQMVEFSRTNDATHSPSSCKYDLLENIKV
jgi:hypothetical protein